MVDKIVVRLVLQSNLNSSGYVGSLRRGLFSKQVSYETASEEATLSGVTVSTTRPSS